MEAVGPTQIIDACTCPNRQGYLILGACVLPEIPVPEPCCGTGGAECAFGISHCRCVRSRSRMGGSPPVALRPRDEVRRDVRVVCDL